MFIGGEIAGGDEDIEKMAANGELKKKLDKLKINHTFS